MKTESSRERMKECTPALMDLIHLQKKSYHIKQCAERKELEVCEERGNVSEKSSSEDDQATLLYNSL